MLLLRQPRLLLAVALVAVVVGFVAAAPVVFLGSVSSASVTRQLEPLCRGLSIDPGIDDVPVDLNRMAAAAAATGGFGQPIGTILGGRQPDLTPMTASSGDRSAPVQVGTRTGWETRVPGGATADDRRVWLPDTVAGPLGLGAGDRLTLSGAAGEMDVEIGGVIPDLVGAGDDPFWCPLGPELGSNLYLAVSVAPAPMLVTSEAMVEEVLSRVGGAVTWRRVEVPFETLPTTIGTSQDAIGDMDRLEAAVVAEGLLDASARPLPDRPITGRSRLRYVEARSTAVREAVRGAVTPMAAVSGLAALGLTAGVGVTWVDRRRTQARLLWARGVAPGWIGVKATLEALLPMVAGVALGWGLAVGVVTRVGPGDVLEAGAVAVALGVAGLGAALAVVTLLATVTFRVRRGGEPAGERRRMAWLPWELPVLLAAWWSLQRLRSSGGPVVEGDRLPPVDTLALLFPLLFLFGVAGVAVRLLGIGLRRARGAGRRWPTAPYLALRRLAAETSTVVVLTALLALAAGVVTYGAGLVRSSEATAGAKAAVELGTDVVARLTSVTEVPETLRGRATVVLSGRNLEYEGDPVDGLFVDPGTFADAAFWDDSFAEASLPALLRRLDGPGPSGGVPAIAAGATPAPSGRLSLQGRPAIGEEVDVVAGAIVWPSLKAYTPLLVLPRGGLGELGSRVAVELWVRDATEAEVRRAMVDAGIPIVYVIGRDRITDTSAFLPTIWTFGFVQALGAVVGVLALVGLLAYAEARQRARALGYTMARRMGLTTGGHWRALVLELGVLAVVALVTGVASGWIAVRAVNAVLDADADRPPPALLRVPWPALAAMVLLALAAVVVVAALAQRVAAQADPAEVLRGEI